MTDPLSVWVAVHASTASAAIQAGGRFLERSATRVVKIRTVSVIIELLLGQRPHDGRPADGQ